jgi:TPR repeat protein
VAREVIQALRGSQDDSKDTSSAGMPTSDAGLPAEDTDRPPWIAELERRAEAGDGASAGLLGDHYREGDAVSQDSNLAFRWYSRGADLGDMHAQNNLGSMFLNGLGCEQDPARAIDWYRKSAEQGLATAQYNLAKRYDLGDGIEQNSVEARKWYEKAAVQGDTDASREVGTIHLYGQGVPRNLLAAAEYHLIAAEEGDDLAYSTLSRYRGELEEMALCGSQLASLFLSRIYNRGFGVEKSQAMTWAWISCAKKHGLSDVYPDTAQEVAETYAFYHMCITTENRKEGQKRLKDLRASHTRQLRKQP